jgi:hypothetical protein
VTRVGVHQPNYFPWIGYFHKLAAADVFVLLDNVEFQRGNASSVTNRTTIKTSQGIQKITVPVLRAGASPLVQDVLIDSRQPWKKKHCGALTAAYGRAPAFGEIFPMVAATVEGAGESLAALNRESISLVCRILGLDRPIILASSLGLTATEKNERLVEICGRVGATTYLSGRGARRYNDEDLFRSHGIRLEYSRFNAMPYPQLHGEFVPNLSMLDALFACGTGARRLLETVAL